MFEKRSKEKGETFSSVRTYQAICFSPKWQSVTLDPNRWIKCIQAVFVAPIQTTLHRDPIFAFHHIRRPEIRPRTSWPETPFDRGSMNELTATSENCRAECCMNRGSLPFPVSPIRTTPSSLFRSIRSVRKDSIFFINRLTKE